ncbi:hypothetical protein AB0B50_25780 [Streptomyces sp. NPDC041068]|uniref:hypothetical protein n=1 Tax=Streptomyces sp. NPDC041068 TaxID=3155130 RepID=UPI0033F8E325
MQKVKSGLVAAAAAGALATGIMPAGAAEAPTPTVERITKFLNSAAPSDTVDAAAPCRKAITRFNYTGYRACGEGRVMDVDWDRNGSVDESFVIAPNREIWHIWANSRGWKELPGDGRGDTFWGWSKYGRVRCVAVWAGSTVWDNPFDGSRWLGWERGTC